jgi:putative transposase
MARSRYCFGEVDRPHFLTCTVVEWLPVFTHQDGVQILFDTWGYQQQHEGLKLIGFVILENHLHAVAQAENLPQTWARFKSFSARKIISLLKSYGAKPLLDRLQFAYKAARADREHQFWQEGSHPQVIVDKAMLVQKLEYIHNNPVKRGYVDAPEDWRWSSARNYAGRDGVIEVYMDW